MASNDVACPLIEPKKVVPRWTVPQRVTAVASVILTVGLAGYSVASVASNQQGKTESDRTIGELVKFLGSNETTSLDALALKQSCYGATGGTCLAMPCKDVRKSLCLIGQCVCPAGQCSGADGICYPSEYKKVASAVSFTNGYWSGYWLYLQSMSLLSQLSTSNSPAATFGGSQLFDVYELPGTPNGKKEYFLASNKWKSWVASIRYRGLFALNLDHKYDHWNVQKVIVHLCTKKHEAATSYPNSIMIGSPGIMGNPAWAYVHGGSSLVYSYWLGPDPGSGGYWTPSVPIEGLQDCPPPGV